MEHIVSDLIHGYSNGSGIPVASYSSCFGIRTNFSITTNKFGDFFEKYCELAFEDERADEGDGIPPTPLCIAETVDKPTLPLIGNFRFKFQVEEGEEDRSYYNEDLPMKIIKCYQKAMIDLLNISSGMSECVCCLLEGHSYRKSDYVIIDMMIQFPFCQLDAKFTKKTFKPYVEKLLRQNKIIESFETHPVGDWKEHMKDFDNLIPLYRSTIDKGVPHLSLTHIYGLIDDNHIEEMTGPEIELSEIFKPSTHSFVYNGKVPINSIPDEEAEDEYEDFYRFWLPLFLSIHFWAGQTIPKNNDSDEKEVKKSAYYVEDGDSDNPMRMLHSLLPLLSNERANKDYSWLDVGKVIYNTYKGSEEGLNAWVSFSARGNVPGRGKDVCTYRYPEFKENNLLTVRTIAWYVREDNPDAYEEWHTNWCMKALNEAMSTSHTDVAKALYRVFWMHYIYSGDTQTWYHYRSNYYKNIGKEPYPLRKEYTEHFVAIFTKMRDKVSNESVKVTSEQAGKKDLDYKIKALTDLIIKLKNEAYKSTVIKASKDYFIYEDFERKCDKNHLLTALSNCVLEVVDKRVRPRPGKPEDYVLKFSDLEYPFEYTFDSHWVKEIQHWFDQITVGDRELKHYFLKRIASFLRGLNPEKLFDVWTNSGNNSKSMVTKTLQKMYGAYFVDFPVSLLASGNIKSSSSASPELAQACNSRAAIMAEPDDRMSLSSGMIKRLTGGDRMFARALHDNGGSMDLTFKTIMVCNRIPTIASVDKATINRFVIVPFLGTWAEDAPESEEEQFKLRKFKMDPFFESKIPQLARALMWLSVQYYPYYANEGLAFPPIVKEYIKKHWDDNDHYLQFIAEKIDYAYKDKDKKDIDTDASITAQELYKFFTPWFKDYYPGVNVPTLAEFKDDVSMSGRLGPQPKRGLWLGIKMKNIVPDIGAGIKI